MKGEIADALYIIVEGKVELTGSTFKDVLGPHDAVGLYAVLADEPRYASARILEDTFAFKIGAQDFYDLLSHNAEIVSVLVHLRHLLGDDRTAERSSSPVSGGDHLVGKRHPVADGHAPLSGVW